MATLETWVRHLKRREWKKYQAVVKSIETEFEQKSERAHFDNVALEELAEARRERLLDACSAHSWAIEWPPEMEKPDFWTKLPTLRLRKW